MPIASQLVIISLLLAMNNRFSVRM